MAQYKTRVIVSDPKRRSGALTLKGTRFPVSKVLAEIADSGSVEEVARRFNLDIESLNSMLCELAGYIQGYDERKHEVKSLGRKKNTRTSK